MHPRRLHTLEIIVWIALAIALIGDLAPSHVHPADHDATHNATRDSFDLGWVPDEHHEEHSNQSGHDLGPCGLCRSGEDSWGLRRTTNETLRTLNVASAQDRAPQIDLSADPSLGNQPRAPPA